MDFKEIATIFLIGIFVGAVATYVLMPECLECEVCENCRDQGYILSEECPILFDCSQCEIPECEECPTCEESECPEVTCPECEVCASCPECIEEERTELSVILEKDYCRFICPSDYSICVIQYDGKEALLKASHTRNVYGASDCKLFGIKGNTVCIGI